MKYYTIKEAAKILNINTRLLYNAIHRGQLKKSSFTKNGEITIAEDELQLFKEGRGGVVRWKIKANDKLQIINTNLGKVRKIEGTDAFVLADINKALGFKKTGYLAEHINRKFSCKISPGVCKTLGIKSNNGLVLADIVAIEEYILNPNKLKRKRGLKQFLNELKIDIEINKIPKDYSEILEEALSDLHNGKKTYNQVRETLGLSPLNDPNADKLLSVIEIKGSETSEINVQPPIKPIKIKAKNTYLLDVELKKLEELKIIKKGDYKNLEIEIG